MIFSVSNGPLIWTAAVPLAFKLWLKWAVCLSVWNKPSVFLSEMSHLSLWLKWAVYLNSLNTSVECLLINSKNMSQGCLKWQLYKYLCVCVCVCLYQFTNIHFVLYHEKDRIKPTAYFWLGWLSWLFVFVCGGGVQIVVSYIFCYMFCFCLDVSLTDFLPPTCLSLSHIMSLSACLWAAGFSELTHRQTELERIFPFFLIDEVAHLSADVSSKYFRERYVICIMIVCVFQWNGEETK